MPDDLPSTQDHFPENPVLARAWRGDHVESQHRGAWVLVDTAGNVLEGEGAHERAFFARSSTKSLQALPLIETGAAERFGLSDAELALALASHSGEALHTDVVAALLARLELGAEHLLCGSQIPFDRDARADLERRGERPTAVHNNCSGKHAGFLALALHLGVEPARYIDPESEGQQLVREAVLEMTGVAEGDLTTAVDGCSAPTFRMPLTALATAFARVTNPDGLGAERRAACERMLAAVAEHPVHIAGSHKRLCTDLVRASGGRLFAKVGGEAIYAVGIRGADSALAVKVDDGANRGLYAVVVTLLRRLGLLEPDEDAALASWGETPLSNWAGREVGRIEVPVRARCT
ncbi:MAG: asparaginase [bacterium]|nr:asparaginase [bacterium]